MKKTTLAAIVLMTGAASLVLAAPGMLTLKKDKAERFGDITETPTSYRISFQGRLLEVPKADATVQYGTLEEIYKLKKGKLTPRDVSGHYALALWAKEQKLDRAMAEQLEEVLAINPNHVNAKLLLDAYRMGLSARPKPEPGKAPPATQPVNVQGPVAKFPLLTDADINVIRVVELGRGESLPVRPAPGAIDKVWNDIEGKKPEFTGEAARRRFYARPSAEQLAIAIDNLATVDDLYKLADLFAVTADPRPLLTWKTRIHPWLMNSCAASDCHGNTNPGKVPYQVLNVASPDSAVIYTNFFLTTQYKGKDGALLDFDLPEESLILQYALSPKGMGVKEHPKVKDVAITPALRSKTDPMYRLIWNWIGNRAQGGLRSPQRLSYHITWPPPGSAEEPPKPPPEKSPEVKPAARTP